MTDLSKLQRSPVAFRNTIRTECDTTPKKLGSVLDPWQKADFEALDPGWKQIAGFGDGKPHVTRGWLERPRGHSKTTDLAVMATWALFASRRKLSGYAAAADRDQAKLLHESIVQLIRLNPWLDDYLNVQQFKIVNAHTGSSITFLSSDAPTSYGLTPDFLVVDEVSNWPSRDLWDSLISAAAKKKSCQVVGITNAGWIDTWVFNVREEIRESDNWYFSRLDGPVATWLTDDRLEEQKKMLPRVTYARLWLNEWSSGSGNAIEPDTIRRAICHTGPQSNPGKGYRYVAGLDLGVKRDQSAFVIVGVHVGHVETVTTRQKYPPALQSAIEAGLIPSRESEKHTLIAGTGKIRLAECVAWEPPKGKEVNLQDVENVVATLSKRFGVSVVAFDPHQAMQMSQRLQKQGIKMQEVPFTGNNLQKMASETLESFAESRIELYDDNDLLRDLERLKIVERSYGFRLSPRRDATGHGDRATAFVLALLMARKFRRTFRGLHANSLMLQPPDDSPLTAAVPPTSYAGFG